MRSEVLSNVSKGANCVAFLGPIGTYSHQIAFDHFGELATYVERSSIADAYHALTSDVFFCIIPKENSIFGSVVETYDLLRRPEVGIQRFIRGEATLRVQHCLLVKRGTKLDDVKYLLSHEQALGQCAGFRSRNLPQAAVVKVNSTAAAAQRVAENTSADSAAICSSVCASVYDGLEIIARNIQDEDNNYTKFWILSSSSSDPLPGHSEPISESQALLRLISRETEACQETDLSVLMNQLGLRISQIDRRPSMQAKPFHSMYFLEVTSSSAEETGRPWREQLNVALERVREIGWDGHVLGIW